MNLIFVVPPSPDNRKIIRIIDCTHEAKANYLWQPYDYMAVTSLCRTEDKVFLVDGTADCMSSDVFFSSFPNVEIDILFFALSGVCWNSDFDYFKKVKSVFKNVPTFVTGQIFMDEYYQKIILEHCDGIVVNPFMLDMFLMRNAQNASSDLPGIIRVFDSDYFKKSRVKKPVYVNTGVPRHNVFRKKGYRFPFARHFNFATITTTWGCPFSCSYCGSSRFSPVCRPYESVAKELEYLSDIGIKELFFSDKVFGFPTENIAPLLEIMAKKRRFSWSCYFHPQLYNEKLLDLMNSAGCHTIITGAESANMASLKTYNRSVNKDRFYALLNHANKLEMNICADFILGLEHETEDDVLKTVEWALSLPIDFVSLNIATPVPGSDIREKAFKSGKLVFGQDEYDTLGSKNAFGSEFIEPEKLLKIRNDAIRKFYLKPDYLLKRLRKTKSFEHFLIQLQEMIHMFKKSRFFRSA